MQREVSCHSGRLWASGAIKQPHTHWRASWRTTKDMSSNNIAFLCCYVPKYKKSWSGRGDVPKLFSCTCEQKGKGLLYSKDERRRWAEWVVALQSLCFRAVTAWLATWQLSGAAIPSRRTEDSLHVAVSLPAEQPPTSLQAGTLPPGPLGMTTQCGRAKRTIREGRTFHFTQDRKHEDRETEGMASWTQSS